MGYLQRLAILFFFEGFNYLTADLSASINFTGEILGF